MLRQWKRMKFFRVVHKWKKSTLSPAALLDWIVQWQAAARLTYTFSLADVLWCR